MATEWTFPSIFLQYAETCAESVHTPWNEANNFDELKNNDGRQLQTDKVLYHIARSPKPDIKNKTYYLKLTGFNFQNLPNSLTGIELRIQGQRYGRVTDDTVHLIKDDEQIGDNKATLPIHITKIYGGNEDNWNTALTISDVMSSNFGVLLRFKAHPNWPHSSPMFLDSVEMRIH